MKSYGLKKAVDLLAADTEEESKDEGGNEQANMGVIGVVMYYEMSSF